MLRFRSIENDDECSVPICPIQSGERRVMWSAVRSLAGSLKFIFMWKPIEFRTCNQNRTRNEAWRLRRERAKLLNEQTRDETNLQTLNFVYYPPMPLLRSLSSSKASVSRNWIRFGKMLNYGSLHTAAVQFNWNFPRARQWGRGRIKLNCQNWTFTDSWGWLF